MYQKSKNKDLNKITEHIIKAAVDIHKTLGPGLLETAYEKCLVYELSQKNLKIEQQKPLPVIYKNVKLDCAYRLDLLVEDEVVVELKAVEILLPIHQAQLLSYLKLASFKVGLLLNFNERFMVNGIKRLVNNY